MVFYQFSLLLSYAISLILGLLITSFSPLFMVVILWFSHFFWSKVKVFLAISGTLGLSVHLIASASLVSMARLVIAPILTARIIPSRSIKKLVGMAAML